MGIRIKKCVGYALTDLKTEDYSIVDERIDPDGFLFSDYHNAENNWTLEGFRDFLKEKSESLDGIDRWDSQMEANSVYEMTRKKKSFSFYDCFISDIEFGDPNVLLCMPVSCIENWYRRDDTLDWIEETQILNPNSDDPYASRVFELKSNIYPWTGQHWDKRDGRMINIRSVTDYKWILNSGRDEFLTDEFVKETLGFENKDEADEFMSPAVPQCLQYLIEYCKIFKDSSSVYEMKPIHYTFWS